ncbi:hypothetical protein BDW74DRAFT_12986 [Aspergillus multicolor]|uniref:uncharacterized protein n=1 Tax=Aspergillus multicolor TaxID=41759 RepID=UPI003CCCC409
MFAFIYIYSSLLSSLRLRSLGFCTALPLVSALLRSCSIDTLSCSFLSPPPPIRLTLVMTLLSLLDYLISEYTMLYIRALQNLMHDFDRGQYIMSISMNLPFVLDNSQCNSLQPRL